MKKIRRASTLLLGKSQEQLAEEAAFAREARQLESQTCIECGALGAPGERHSPGMDYYCYVCWPEDVLEEDDEEDEPEPPADETFGAADMPVVDGGIVDAAAPPAGPPPPLPPSPPDPQPDGPGPDVCGRCHRAGRDGFFVCTTCMETSKQHKPPPSKKKPPPPGKKKPPPPAKKKPPPPGKARGSKPGPPAKGKPAPPARKVGIEELEDERKRRAGLEEELARARAQIEAAAAEASAASAEAEAKAAEQTAAQAKIDELEQRISQQSQDTIRGNALRALERIDLSMAKTALGRSFGLWKLAAELKKSDEARGKEVAELQAQAEAAQAEAAAAARAAEAARARVADLSGTGDEIQRQLELRSQTLQEEVDETRARLEAASRELEEQREIAAQQAAPSEAAAEAHEQARAMALKVVSYLMQGKFQGSLRRAWSRWARIRPAPGERDPATVESMALDDLVHSTAEMHAELLHMREMIQIKDAEHAAALAERDVEVERIRKWAGDATRSAADAAGREAEAELRLYRERRQLRGQLQHGALIAFSIPLVAWRSRRLAHAWAKLRGAVEEGHRAAERTHVQLRRAIGVAVRARVHSLGYAFEQWLAAAGMQLDPEMLARKVVRLKARLEALQGKREDAEVLADDLSDDVHVLRSELQAARDKIAAHEEARRALIADVAERMERQEARAEREARRATALAEELVKTRAELRALKATTASPETVTRAYEPLPPRDGERHSSRNGTRRHGRR